MQVVTVIPAKNITPKKIYEVSDYDEHTGWITDDSGTAVYIQLDTPCPIIGGDKWFIVYPTKKAINSYIELIDQVQQLKPKKQENIMSNLIMPSDKLSKASESVTYYKYSNGYMVECSGRDAQDDYKYLKIIAPTIHDVIEILEDFDSLPLDD